MNKLLITLLIGIMSTQISSAQLIKSYGIKAAYTSANQSYKSSSDGLDRRPGVCAALFAEWFNDPYLSLVTQVEYAQRGTVAIVNSTIPELFWVTRTFDNRLDYLSIPLLLKLGLPQSFLRAYVLAGPRVDFLLGYKSEDNWFDYQDRQFKKTSYGVSFGIGLQLTKVLPFDVLLEGRYNADISNSYSPSYPVRNNSIDIWLGLGL